MSVVLECPFFGCKEVPDSARWKTPLLLSWQAEEELECHLLYNHPFGRQAKMNELVSMVSLDATDPQIKEK